MPLIAALMVFGPGFFLIAVANGDDWTPEGLQRVADRVLTDIRYQRTLPDSVLEETEPMRTGPTFDFDPGVFGPLAQAVLYSLIVACIVVAGLWLYRGRSSWRREPRTSESVAMAAETVPLEGDAVLRDADALASAGRYAEAIHVLLLRTIEAMRARLDRHLAPSLTSREILTRVALGDDARHALGVLVSAVEVSLFGGRSADTDEYQKCRTSFERFAEALQGPR